MPDQTQQQRREGFYDEIRPLNMAPLWEVLHDLITKEPKSPVQPALWRYADVRPHIIASGDLITAKEAERRVLILENPGMPGKARITTSLYAGLQLILPGEVAPAHRHSQSALRFVVEGDGAYTAVDGEKTLMRPGDFVITPSWTWHDHGNDSAEPMVWLDGLDIPIISMFDASFVEKWGEDRQPIARPVGDSLARYGQGMLPDGYTAPTHTSPVFSYPYSRTRDALETMRRTAEWDPAQGLKLRYVNPANGDHAIPTMATFMQLLPAGFTGVPYRATDAMVFSVVEGTGKVTIADQTFTFGPRDHFVVPSWAWYSLDASEDVTLFSFSDRPVQEKLDLWREQRGNG